MLEISWPQLITNVIGFLILFLGLKRLAWGPILGLLEERQSRIKKEIETVEQARQQAAALEAEFENKLKEIDALARKRIEEAVREAQAVGADMKEKARLEAAAIYEKAKADIEREREQARVALRDDLVKMVMVAGEKVLRVQLTPGVHEQLITRYIDELEGIKP